jgi:hypothetical protein
VVESVMSPSELSAVKRAASTVAVAEPREPVMAAGLAMGVAPQKTELLRRGGADLVAGGRAEHEVGDASVTAPAAFGESQHLEQAGCSVPGVQRQVAGGVAAGAVRLAAGDAAEGADGRGRVDIAGERDRAADVRGEGRGVDDPLVCDWPSVPSVTPGCGPRTGWVTSASAFGAPTTTWCRRAEADVVGRVELDHVEVGRVGGVAGRRSARCSGCAWRPW